ncbi:GAF domain-containing protein [Paucibacter sp. TC2R-5]|uniref:two-component regulator propeller domain-containing protein n=1 Tax=Paucibacter sp. TC2R-5 TaxID=2893555 RepID=UPI0021E3B206|nr:two-component regulator propeller domain-containing protein [Paucibacter sp. TC2R-5]MCV2360383.1 GAF domain-containing protein [Paucibacter sp. TC2R-5]
MLKRLGLRPPLRMLCKLVCGLALLGLGVMPPASANSLHSLRFSQLGVDDGLPGGAVLSMVQDSQGLVWLGTTAGLARYDGRRIKAFYARQDQPATLSHSLIDALLEDEQGQLWIGTRAGLDRMDLASEKIQRQPMPEGMGLAERRILALAPAAPGRLWVASTGGLLLFDKASRRFVPWQAGSVGQSPDKSPDKTAARALLADGQGGVWLSRGHQVLHLDSSGQVLRQFSTLDGLSASSYRPEDLMVNRLALDGEARLWVGMAGGLQTWRVPGDGTSPRPDDLAQKLQLPRERVFALLLDRDRAMWVGQGSRPALHRWREGTAQLESFQHLPAVESSLAADSVGALMQDRSGILWVGTLMSGVSLADFGGRRFAAYLSLPGDPLSLSNDVVMATAFDGAEHLWVGTYGGGLNRLHLPSGATQRIAPEAMPLTHIKALLREPDGRLWVGGERGLQLFDPKTQRSRTVELHQSTSAGASISSLLKLANGEVWAGSSNGLYRINAKGQVQSFQADAGRAGALNHAIVDALMQDRDGRLWIGTKGGLHLWDPLTETFLRPVQGNADLPNPAALQVYGLRQDAGGRIWLISELGLFELLPKSRTPGAESWQLKSFADVPGMPSGAFESIQDAQFGSIWMGSEHGLTEFQPEQGWARFYPSASHFGGGFNFGASARAVDGTLYFGGKGLQRFRPEALRDNAHAPQVVLSDLRVFNQSLAPEAAPAPASAGLYGASGPPLSLADLGVTGPLHRASKVQLSPREAMVSFELSALHFDKSPLLKHAWKLEGFDRDWIYGQDNVGLATYTNLDAGRYRLMAKAANPDGVWGEARQLLEVQVLPPFWRTWWWNSGLLLLVLLTLGTAYRMRVRGLYRARTQLEQEVVARTQELQQQTLQLAQEKQIALTQTALALQSREAAERARHDITLLSEIGRQLTASLDVGSIQRTLYQQVDELIEASVFGLGLVNWKTRNLAFDFVMHSGEACKPYIRSLAEVEMPAVQAVLQGKELLVDQIERDSRVLNNQEGASRIQLQTGADPAAVHSGIYAPMLLKGKVVGLLFMLSERSHGFTANDLAILSTLGAYAAVALDNADAYRQLQLTQTQLVEQEKMAALGALVAGVAHELNTPIGNSLLMASTLLDRGREFSQHLSQGGIRRSELDQYCQANQESSELLVRSLQSAAGLVTSFKQLAVDQTSEQRRPFELHQLCSEIAQTLGSRLRREGHELRLDVAPGLALDSFPGPLGQVLSNLVLNALIHGLEGRREGLLTLRASALGDAQIKINFSDNGRGISAANLPHVFEPFFTTKLGQGGSGLGLHISYNIVSSVLGGSITVSSEPGAGAQFEIIIPKVAP